MIHILIGFEVAGHKWIQSKGVRAFHLCLLPHLITVLVHPALKWYPSLPFLYNLLFGCPIEFFTFQNLSNIVKFHNIKFPGMLYSSFSRKSAQNQVLTAQTCSHLSQVVFTSIGSSSLQLLHLIISTSTYWTCPITTGQNCCLNASVVDFFLTHEPQPTSTKNMVHIAQSKLNDI